MARLTEIVIDSLNPASLAKFWQGALDEFTIRAYDDKEIARLAELGLTPDSDPNVALDGGSLTIFFQLTLAVKQQRNRIHLDICAENRAAEVQRLIALGATLRDELAGHSVMLDPESNEFCVTGPRCDKA